MMSLHRKINRSKGIPGKLASLILLCGCLITGCKPGNPGGCDFTKAEVTGPAPGGSQRKETLSDCFRITKTQSPATVAIKGDTLGERFLVKYNDVKQQPGQPRVNLDILTIKTDSTHASWKRHNGNRLSKFERPDSLGLIYEEIEPKVGNEGKHVGDWGAILFRKQL